MQDAVTNGLAIVAEFVPKLISFLLILVIGFFVAKMIAKAIAKVPVNEGDLTTGGLIALVVVVVVTLAGAVLGGLAGMRFHRKVDKAGLGA